MIEAPKWFYKLKYFVVNGELVKVIEVGGKKGDYKDVR